MQSKRQNLLKHRAVYLCIYWGGYKIYDFAPPEVKEAFAASDLPKCGCCSVCPNRYTDNSLHFQDDICFAPVANGKYIVNRSCAGRQADHTMLAKELREGRGAEWCVKCQGYFAKPYAPEGVADVSQPK